METEDALCEALKITFDELKKHGKLHTSLHDGKVYTCFIFMVQTLAQDRLKKLVPANQLIMAMQHLLDDPNTPIIVKENIQKIFDVMDPRDQNYRTGKDCNCWICRLGEIKRRFQGKAKNN